MSSNIVVHELGESIVDARIAKWLKQEGDAVSVGEPLVELETDKVDVEVAAPQSGVLSKIAHANGADVKIGDVLGVVSEGKGQKAEGKGAEREKEKGKGERDNEKPVTGEVAATPAARRLARQEDVDLSKVKPEGPRVTPDDIKSAKPSKPEARTEPTKPFQPTPPPSTAPTAKPRTHVPTTSERSEERIRMSRRRATIAKRLVEAQATAAMLTTFN